MVHESEAVSELMHESSDTGGEAVAQTVFLVAAGVAVDVHSVFGLHLHSPFIHGEGVGPDGVGVVGVGRTLSGVVDIDVVDVSVAVVVILGNRSSDRRGCAAAPNRGSPERRTAGVVLRDRLSRGFFRPGSLRRGGAGFPPGLGR